MTSGADPEGDRRAPDYRMARIGAASAVVGVLVAVLVLDVLSTDYEANVVIVAGLLGTLAALLGVEIRAPRP